jgi:hypothetical protein
MALERRVSAIAGHGLFTTEALRAGAGGDAHSAAERESRAGQQRSNRPHCPPH